MIQFDHAAPTEVTSFFPFFCLPPLPFLFPLSSRNLHSPLLRSPLFLSSFSFTLPPLKLVPALHLQRYPQVSGVGVVQNVK